jgi:hypothetical protein
MLVTISSLWNTTVMQFDEEVNIGVVPEQNLPREKDSFCGPSKISMKS